MELRTYRARTLQEALAMVRRELGPDAAVLHTRDVRGGLLGWLPGARRIEVTASAHVNVPSRLPPKPVPQPVPATAPSVAFEAPRAAMQLRADFEPQRVAPPPEDPRKQFQSDLAGRLNDLQAMVEELCKRSQRTAGHDWPEPLFRIFTDLIEAEICEDIARELVEQVRATTAPAHLSDPEVIQARLTSLVESQIAVSGPIEAAVGQRRLVALVGPTGVGKTTTIAKLAAHYRLREKRKVGLITVDTYRIAAVEQLRTYADIIELPMEVVSTPKEMRAAVARMADLDLVLLDTAGRSPSDEIQIQELKAMLAEAGADEVHLVLSSVSSASSLSDAAERFATVGVTSILLTKLDEAANLGALLPLIRSSETPFSYVTDGQNVPDDIRPADARRLAQAILGTDRRMS